MHRVVACLALLLSVCPLLRCRSPREPHPDVRIGRHASLLWAVRIHPPEGGQKISDPETPVVAFSPDGQTLATGCKDRRGDVVHLWDIATGARILEADAGGYPAYSPDGRILVVRESEEEAAPGRGLDPATGKILPFWGDETLLQPLGDRIVSMVFEEEDDREDWVVTVWDARSCETLLSVKGVRDPPLLSAHGRWMGTMHYPEGIRIWDLESLELKGIVDADPDEIHAFLPDGSPLSYGELGGGVSIRDLGRSERWQVLEGAGWRIDISRDQRYVAAWQAGDEGDGTVRIHDGLSEKPHRILGPHAGGIHRARFSPDGGRLVSVQWASPISYFGVTDGHIMDTDVDGPEPEPLIPPRHRIHLWAIEEEREVLVLEGDIWWNPLWAFSSDGRMIAVVTGDNRIHVHDTSTGEEITSFSPGPSQVGRLLFSPDGRMIASSMENATVALWRVEGSRGDPASLETMWSDLGGTDPLRAHDAYRGLIEMGEAAAGFLEDRIAGLETRASEELSRSTGDLESNEYDVRERATRKLEKGGPSLVPALRGVLDGELWAETRLRIKAILACCEAPRVPAPGDVSRAWRGRAALDRIRPRAER